MADEDLSLNEDQLLDNLDDANGDLLTEVSIFSFFSDNKKKK
jgi:phenylalanyl-tRNA synthetase beta subunit